MSYTTGQMAELTGLSASALRYYDQQGLLPFVKRAPGGARVFEAADYAWLQTIECLKKTGMRLRDIRDFIDMAMEGDGTIEPRLALIEHRREAVRAQIAELQETLEMLDFKCWYYETARQAGTVAVPRDMPIDRIPPQYRAARARLRKLPE